MLIERRRRAEKRDRDFDYERALKQARRRAYRTMAVKLAIREKIKQQNLTVSDTRTMQAIQNTAEAEGFANVEALFNYTRTEHDTPRREIIANAREWLRHKTYINNQIGQCPDQKRGVCSRYLTNQLLDEASITIHDSTIRSIVEHR